jgi:ABC-2 type transport system ATP-binding protein
MPLIRSPIDLRTCRKKTHSSTRPRAPPELSFGVAHSGVQDAFARSAPPIPHFVQPSVNPAHSPVALEIRGLTKRFERPAVDGLNLSVQAGEFYTLLGPNGAGKTTTLRMVTGLLRPDHGSITVFGVDALDDPVGAKRIMAWVSDEPMLYEKLTPLEYLDFVAGLWGIDSHLASVRARDLLSWLDLAPHADERCERLSKGMRQKVALAGALVHEPRLIILDEPFTGLDAGSARLVKEVLKERVRAGCSVIMTTHILDVAERVADRIGVMANGALIAEGTLAELHRQAGSGHTSLEDTFLMLVARNGLAE